MFQLSAWNLRNILRINCQIFHCLYLCHLVAKSLKQHLSRSYPLHIRVIDEQKWICLPNPSACRGQITNLQGHVGGIKDELLRSEIRCMLSWHSLDIQGGSAVVKIPVNDDFDEFYKGALRGDKMDAIEIVDFFKWFGREGTSRLRTRSLLTLLSMDS